MSHLLIRADVMPRPHADPRNYGEGPAPTEDGSTGIPLRDKSIHCVVTSPPYWSLRDYGTATWEGGDPACDHLKPAAHGYDPFATSTLGPNRDGINPTNSAHSDGVKRQQYRDVCAKCGAKSVDRQVGLEKTPREYVDRMVAIFAEVWRVLRDDGTLWLNIGDSYNAAGRKGHGTRVGYKQGTNRASANGSDHVRPSAPRLKPKDLVGIPWRVALALQDWGWYLRSEIIWHKPNPMTESVVDRPSRTHEQIFLLTKSTRYFYDREAVREALAAASVKRDAVGYKASFKGQFVGTPNERRFQAGKPMDSACDLAGRNLRTVWTVPVAGSRENHYASYPTRLVSPCIKAGTSEKGVCPACGAPWRRLVEKTRIPTRPGNNSKVYVDPEGSPYEQHSGSVIGNRDPHRHVTKTSTLGWEPTCRCDAGDPVPPVVMDPFAGTSTTGVVARDLGRHYVGLDLKTEYLGISARRLAEPPRREAAKRPRRVPAPAQALLFDPALEE